MNFLRAVVSDQNDSLDKQFLQELTEKHDVVDSLFLVDGPPWLQAALFKLSLRFQYVTHGNRNAVERLFKELKRRTEQFATHFRRNCWLCGNMAPNLRLLFNQLI